jgi:hypothetical protein
MDFGIAKQIDTTGVTRDQMMIGTLSYMSPEQIQGRKLDGRSDVFSVGVLLYQLLAGERPFPGPGSQVLYQICHQAAPELGVDLGSAGPRLEDLVSRALAKEPEERVKGASRLGDELAQVLDWYSRSVVPPVPDDDQQLLADARRRIRDEPVDETLELYASLVDRNPHSVEARRALRAANRQALDAEKPPPVDDAYPELEATFRAGGTAGELPFHQATQTLMQPPTVMRESASSSGKLVAGLVVVGALALGAALLMRNGPTPIAEPTPTPVPPAVAEGASTPPAGTGDRPVAETAVSAAASETPTGREPAASRGTEGAAPADAGARPVEATPSPLRVSVESDPPGASVVLDGRPAGGVTPLELSLARGSDHSVELSLEGHQGKTLELRAGEVPQRIAVSLEALRPPGSLVVRSSYPVEIVWGGRVLASGESTPQVQLPAGSQTVTLRSQAHFLDVRREVEIQAGQQSQLATPPLGRIHIRATPGNCRIFIDGAFADYPPISNQPIAAGSHRVEFHWPDGKTTVQTVEVEGGESAYVTERR